MAEVDPNATRHLVRNLTEGDEYKFRICAQNAVGRSKPVEADTAVIPSRPLGVNVIIFLQVFFHLYLLSYLYNIVLSSVVLIL